LTKRNFLGIDGFLARRQDSFFARVRQRGRGATGAFFFFYLGKQANDFAPVAFDTIKDLKNLFDISDSHPQFIPNFDTSYIF